MDLKQDKLSKSEWESIEIPAIESEKRIFKLIMKCFNNVNYIENDYIYNDYKSEKLFLKNIGSVISNNKTLDAKSKELDSDIIKKSIDLGYFIEDYKIEYI